MSRGITLLALVVTLSTLGGVANATLLNLPQGRPDITTVGITTTYAGGILSVSGTPTKIDYDGVAPPDFNIISDGAQLRSLQITIQISAGGVASSSGNPDLIIKGVIDNSGINNNIVDGTESYQTLLTGQISAFGYDGASQLMDFLFDVTGGTQAAAYGPKAGVILTLDPSTTFAGTFASGFTDQGHGLADVFAIPTPEPLTAASGLAGLAALGLLAGRRRGR